MMVSRGWGLVWGALCASTFLAIGINSALFFQLLSRWWVDPSDIPRLIEWGMRVLMCVYGLVVSMGEVAAAAGWFRSPTAISLRARNVVLVFMLMFGVLFSPTVLVHNLSLW